MHLLILPNNAKLFKLLIPEIRNQIFGILAAFVSASVIGLILEVYDSSSTVLGIFRWTFMIGLIISMIVMSVHFYAFGYVKNNGKYTFVIQHAYLLLT